MNDRMTLALFLLQVASTLFMTGVIWFVQVVHYPLFARVDRVSFPAYEQTHTTLTSWVVVPAMLIELGSACMLLWLRPEGISATLAWIGLALLAVIWLSTFLIQVPCHETLSKAFDPRVHTRLVETNWIRTVAWSLRSVLVLWMTATQVR